MALTTLYLYSIVYTSIEIRSWEMEIKKISNLRQRISSLQLLISKIYSMEDIRLSVSEAAKIFGISQQTIRRALKANQLKYIIVRNRYRISFLSLLKWSQQSATTRNKLTAKGIGQFVEKWSINNRLYSPHPKTIKKRLKNDS